MDASIFDICNYQTRHSKLDAIAYFQTQQWNTSNLKLIFKLLSSFIDTSGNDSEIYLSCFSCIIQFFEKYNDIYVLRMFMESTLLLKSVSILEDQMDLIKSNQIEEEVFELLRAILLIFKCCFDSIYYETSGFKDVFKSLDCTFSLLNVIETNIVSFELRRLALELIVSRAFSISVAVESKSFMKLMSSFIVSTNPEKEILCNIFLQARNFNPACFSSNYFKALLKTDIIKRCISMIPKKEPTSFLSWCLRADLRSGAITEVIPPKEFYFPVDQEIDLYSLRQMLLYEECIDKLVEALISDALKDKSHVLELLHALSIHSDGVCETIWHKLRKFWKQFLQNQNQTELELAWYLSVLLQICKSKKVREKASSLLETLIHLKDVPSELYKLLLENIDDTKLNFLTKELVETKKASKLEAFEEYFKFLKTLIKQYSGNLVKPPFLLFQRLAQIGEGVIESVNLFLDDYGCNKRGLPDFENLINGLLQKDLTEEEFAKLLEQSDDIEKMVIDEATQEDIEEENDETDLSSKQITFEEKNQMIDDERNECLAKLIRLATACAENCKIIRDELIKLEPEMNYTIMTLFAVISKNIEIPFSVLKKLQENREKKYELSFITFLFNVQKSNTDLSPILDNYEPLIKMIDRYLLTDHEYTTIDCQIQIILLQIIEKLRFENFEKLNLLINTLVSDKLSCEPLSIPKTIYCLKGYTLCNLIINNGLAVYNEDTNVLQYIINCVLYVFENLETIKLLNVSTNFEIKLPSIFSMLNTYCSILENTIPNGIIIQQLLTCIFQENLKSLEILKEKLKGRLIHYPLNEILKPFVQLLLNWAKNDYKTRIKFVNSSMNGTTLIEALNNIISSINPRTDGSDKITMENIDKLIDLLKDPWSNETELAKSRKIDNISRLSRTSVTLDGIQVVKNTKSFSRTQNQPTQSQPAEDLENRPSIQLLDTMTNGIRLLPNMIKSEDHMQYHQTERKIKEKKIASNKVTDAEILAQSLSKSLKLKKDMYTTENSNRPSVKML
eukprot:TRINITY_DN3011_c0_g1_i1.p1 TRINITY_DN3011_c0_g1~~TRINITY_DN3011_c0_g1_i1.p1  ORF type:complete len:1017 (-),score=306.96 TRINITY_DN3011_c0_g1_i1:13-3063(-)